MTSVPRRPAPPAGGVPPTTEHEFGAEPTEGDVLGDGVRLHYLDWGAAPTQKGPPILFVHGAGLTGHTWDVVCDLLRTDHRCICLELRGHGDSEWSRDGHYGFESYVADLGRAVDALGLDRFVLVGMSLGGMASLAWAGEHGARLRGLVIVDTGPRQPRPPSEGLKRMAQFMETKDVGTLDDFIERSLKFNPLRTRDRLARSLMFSLRPLEDGQWTWKWDPRIRPRLSVPAEVEEHQRRGEVRDKILWHALAQIGAPTLLVRGGMSDMFLDEDAERVAAALEKGRWLRIEGAGHTVQGDQPYALTDALREFLGGDILPS